jgi:hypothetical protein
MTFPEEAIVAAVVASLAWLIVLSGEGSRSHVLTSGHASTGPGLLTWSLDFELTGCVDTVPISFALMRELAVSGYMCETNQ